MNTAKKMTLCIWTWVLLLAAEPAHAFYDPDTQRWLNRDPMHEDGGINLFAFVGNEPAGTYDRLGLEGRSNGGSPSGGGKKGAPKKPNPKPNPAPKPGPPTGCPNFQCQWPHAGGEIKKMPDEIPRTTPGAKEILNCLDCKLARTACNKGCDLEYGVAADNGESDAQNKACYDTCKNDCKAHYNACEQGKKTGGKGGTPGGRGCGGKE